MDLTPSAVFSALTLLFLVLNFAFGRGDRGAAKIAALEERQHQHELAMRDLEARLKDHVGGGYATKEDIRTLRQEVAGLRELFQPIADQLTVRAVRSG